MPRSWKFGVACALVSMLLVACPRSETRDDGSKLEVPAEALERPPEGATRVPTELRPPSGVEPGTASTP